MKFQRYLEAKKSVEEDCLSLRVLDDVRGRLKNEDNVSVFEAGAGVGSMVQHLVERDVLPDRFTYTALDIDAENVERGRKRLADWGRRCGYTVERDDAKMRFDGAKRFDVTFAEGDLYDYGREADEDGEDADGYDLVVAHALLDILDLRRAVDHLFALGDAFYFPVCFDGVTAFEPPFDGDGECDEDSGDCGGFDARVERAYHATMDAEGRAGSSKTGRRVFDAVRSAGGTVTSAGASDWLVFPDGDGYTDDEEALLLHILKTVHGAVRDEGSLDEDKLDAWYDDRKSRVDDGTLVYVAHQIDFAGRCGDGEVPNHI